MKIETFPIRDVIKNMMMDSDSMSVDRAISIVKASAAEGLIGIRYNPKNPDNIFGAIGYLPSLSDFLTEWKITKEEYANAVSFMHSIDIDEELGEDEEDDDDDDNDDDDDCGEIF